MRRQVSFTPGQVVKLNPHFHERDFWTPRERAMRFTVSDISRGDSGLRYVSCREIVNGGSGYGYEYMFPASEVMHA